MCVHMCVVARMCIYQFPLNWIGNNISYFSQRQRNLLKLISIMKRSDILKFRSSQNCQRKNVNQISIETLVHQHRTDWYIAAHDTAYHYALITDV